MRIAYKFITFVLLFSFFISAVSAAIPSPDLQERMQHAGPYEKISVIISLTNQLDLIAFHKKNSTLTKKDYRKTLISALHANAKTANSSILKSLKLLNVSNTRELWLKNQLAVKLTSSEISTIKNLPGIDSIKLDQIIYLATTISGTQSTPEWNIDLIGVPKLWKLGYRGKGVVIANMDTGVDIFHPDLGSKWRGGTNSWFDSYDNTSNQPNDLVGHGTQTLGVLVGGDNGGTDIGVAPDAQWIAAKIFDGKGAATVSGIHAAFQWLLDPDGDPNTDDQPDVVNASWGDTSVDICNTEFAADIEALKMADIAIVFSAGNAGPSLSTSVSPANNKGVFSVGAVDEYSNVAWFSSRGPSPTVPATNPCTGSLFPNVVAPGMNIKTSDRTSGGVFPNSYQYVNGTSFAAPHVAGVMALLKNAQQDISVNELESVISASTIDIDLQGNDNNTGRGLIDSVGAIIELGIDTDSDSIPDKIDNCVLIANTGQFDTDNDGFGNRCDADFNNSGIVDFTDYFTFVGLYGTSNSLGDFDNNGSVDFKDYFIFISLYNKQPGPILSTL